MRTSRRPRVLLAALAILFVALGATAAAGKPPAFSADYQLSRNGFRVARATITLSYPSPDHYLYRSYTRPTRLVSWFRDDRRRESSRGLVSADSLRPLEYHYALTGSDHPRHADLRFDWKKAVVENAVGDHTWDMHIPSDTLDKLVVQLALMMDLGGGARSVRFHVADGGKLKVYRFKVVGHARLTTPAGQFDTVKVERRRSDNKQVTNLWCAPSLHYLPVKIERRDRPDGTRYRSVLQSVSPSLRVQPEIPQTN